MWKSCMEMNWSSQKGFTLVEMSIVLIIVGIVLSMGMGMIGPLTKLARTRENKEILSKTVESLNSWAAGRNRLPQSFTDSTSASWPLNDTLGHPLIYLVDANLSPSTATKDTICGRSSTQLTLTTNNYGVVTTINNLAFIVLSSGDNYQVETTMNGSLTTPPNSAVQLNNVVIPASGYVTPAGSGTTATVTYDAGSSDDLIKWVTLDELRSKVGCQGAPLRIVNNEVPTGREGTLYSPGFPFSFTIDGGATPGAFRWCVESTASPLAPALPTGLIFTPDMTGKIRAPSTCNTLAETDWVSWPTLSISGTPSSGSSASYRFTVYVRDNNDATGPNDNIAAKSFVLTVNSP
jgi:prepilin-type N-terminal cleavage/methylation domain-containing protein